MDVFIIAALTADGYIGRSGDDRALDWTSREDTKFFVRESRKAGAMVMGSSTLSTVRHPMKDIAVYALTSKPERVHEFTPVNIKAVTGTPHDVIAQAERDGHTSLAVCGGTSVYTQFMQAKVVQRLILTIEPVLFGTGVTLFSESLDAQLELAKVHDLSDQVKAFEYQVQYA